MYKKAKTTIQIWKLKETIEVTCGIRQGCSIYTLLFKMVTFTIIEDLRKKADLYNIGDYKDNLWLANDATIIARDVQSLEKVMDVLESAGKENGLELSEENTRTLRIRGPKIEGKIGKYKIENESKYLGIQIRGKGRDIFQAENKLWIQEAEKSQ